MCGGGDFDRPDAEDLTQGLFTRLVEKKALRAADPERGRFRSFLLASLKHYLANEWHRARAKKRGGGQPVLSLDFAAGEGRYRLEPANSRTPEAVFLKQWALSLLDRVLADRYRLEPASSRTPEAVFLKQWALSLLDRVLADLEAEMAEKGQRQRFEALRGHLTGEPGGLRYRQVAERLGMTEGAVKVAVHRLRQRFGQLLRLAVADTVSSAEEVDREIASLLEALGS